MSNLIQLRRDTEANWTANNPILAAGELALTTDTDPPKLKVGDGTNNWSTLTYITGTGGGGGGVTSVGLSSSDLSVSGSPITTSGTITANLVTQGGVSADTYGDADNVAQVTVNNKGIITGISEVAINKQYDFVIPFQAVASGNLTLTNQAVAAQFLGNSNRNITLVDLSNINQVRLVARVVTASASVNSPRLKVMYKTGAFSTTVGDYSNIAASGEAAAALTPVGVTDSGWVDIADLAKVDNVYLTIQQIGGDAAADPAVGLVTVRFRS